MVYSHQFPKTISTSKTSISDDADFSVTNPLKKDVFCNGIEVVPSPEFTRKGVMIVKIDGITQYDSRNTNGFLRMAKVPITLNLLMKRDVKVEIFIFNVKDENIIECTVNVFLSEESKQLDSSMQYISDDVVNSLVSEEEILFENKVYFNETVTKLIDMKGYKKLIVNMSASTILDIELNNELNKTLNIPSVTVGIDNLAAHPHSFGVDNAGATVLYSSVLLTQLSLIASTYSYEALTETEIQESIYDMLTTEIHILEFDFTEISEIINLSQRISPIGVAGEHDNLTKLIVKTFFRIEESDMPTSGFTLVSDYGVQQFTGTKSFSGITKRYVKILAKHEVYIFLSGLGVGNVGSFPSPTIFSALDIVTSSSSIYQNIFDGIKKGGTAALSIDEKNLVDGLFTEFIPANEFGTISEGGSIKKQLGDVSNIAESGKTYILPSTQNGLLAVLRITGGGIEIGVAIRKVS